MYYRDSDDELNVYFGIVEYYDNRNNNNKENTPRLKGQPIKKTKKKKSSFLTVKKAYLKETHAEKINEEDNDEIMDTSYNKDKNKYEGMTLDSKRSTQDPPNTGQIIVRDDKKETTEN